MIVDDSLERHIWNIDIFDGNIFDLYRFCCVNLSITDVSLLVHWRFVDDSLKKHWRYREDFHANIEFHKCFHWPNLRKIDVSLLLCWWSLMILWRDIFEILIISMGIYWCLLILLFYESLMFHCFFIDDYLMTPWTIIDETRKIWTQTFLINRAFNVHCFKFWCFTAAWLINRYWRFVEETLMRLWWLRRKH